MLHRLKPAHGSRFKRKRVARGNSAGGGTTAGRGTKGQQSRVGKGRKFGFEGGQVPLLMRQPKLGGFTPPRQKMFEPINTGMLETMLEAGTYSLDQLRAKKLIRRRLEVKLLNEGKVTKAFHVSVHSASKSAKAAIEKAGGSVTLLPRSK